MHKLIKLYLNSVCYGFCYLKYSLTCPKKLKKLSIIFVKQPVEMERSENFPIFFFWQKNKCMYIRFHIICNGNIADSVYIFNSIPYHINDIVTKAGRILENRHTFRKIIEGKLPVLSESAENNINDIKFPGE